MAYCKTTTYINLKRIADRAHARALESQTELDWETFIELEMECADYAYINETEIDWSKT